MELFQVNDSEEEQEYREKQAEDFFKLLRMKLHEITTLYASMHPEQQAMMSADYLHGMTDALMRTGPDLGDEIAQEYEKFLCDPKVSDTAALTVMRLAHHMPEIASPKSFDCVFSARGDKEDIVLWNAMDTWRTTGLPMPESLAKIQETASDKRTLDRFRDPDELREERLKESERASAEFEKIPLEERIRLSASPPPEPPEDLEAP